jgi:hypothetical protein
MACMHAGKTKMAGVVDFLIERRADALAVDESGWCMVHHASIIDTLLAVLLAGAPRDHRDNGQNTTALVFSCMIDSGDKIRTLVALGADLTAAPHC